MLSLQSLDGNLPITGQCSQRGRDLPGLVRDKSADSAQTIPTASLQIASLDTYEKAQNAKLAHRFDRRPLYRTLLRC